MLINDNFSESISSFFTKMEELAKQPKRYLALDSEKDFYKEIGPLKKLCLMILSFFNSNFKNPSSFPVLRFHLIKNLLKNVDHLSKDQVNEIKVIAKKIGIISGKNDSLNELIDDCCKNNKDRESLDKKIETYFKKHSKQLSHFFDLQASLLPTTKVEMVAHTPESLSLETPTLGPSIETKKNSSSEGVVNMRVEKSSAEVDNQPVRVIIGKKPIEEPPLPVDPSAVASKNSNVKKMILGGVALTILTIGLGVLAANYYPWSKPSDEQKSDRTLDDQGTGSENNKLLVTLNKVETKIIHVATQQETSSEFNRFINKINGEDINGTVNKIEKFNKKTHSIYNKINKKAQVEIDKLKDSPYDAENLAQKYNSDTDNYNSNRNITLIPEGNSKVFLNIIDLFLLTVGVVSGLKFWYP